MPGGSDLAFTNNPDLKPERTESYDFGIEQRLLNNQLSLDATYFHNSYRDLIVGLGGSLSVLSQYETDNLAKANAKGVEASARFRPATWISLTGNYMWLETVALDLNGGSGLVQQYYYPGQPLIRQPKHSGSLVANFHYGKVDANVTGYFRGHDLDVEPNYGASAGLLLEPRLRQCAWSECELPAAAVNLTLYANLRNALDRRYEEIYGFPSPLLNVVAGVKWSLARAR